MYNYGSFSHNVRNLIRIIIEVG